MEPSYRNQGFKCVSFLFPAVCPLSDFSFSFLHLISAQVSHNNILTAVRRAQTGLSNGMSRVCVCGVIYIACIVHDSVMGCSVVN